MPNDDRLFPGRDISQVTNLEDGTNEWVVELIDTHYGKGTDSLFKVVWKAGDHTWLPYEKVKHLEALNTYLEVLGVNSIENLPMGNDEPDTDDPQITVHTVIVSWKGYQPNTHYGKGTDSLFKVVWKAGDHTWLPYEKVKHLEALNTYLEVLGVDSIENLPMGNDEPDTDDPQITVHTVWVEHEAILASLHVNNVYQLKDSHKKHWKKFRRISKTLTMNSDSLPVNFFAPNSNVPNAPPERFTEPDTGPITQSWATFDTATSTSYVFLAAELRKVFEFHRYIETNSIPPGVNQPERYLIIRRLYNGHVPDFYALAALPPFADPRHLAEAIQNHFDYSRRKNLASNQAQRKLTPGIEKRPDEPKVGDDTTLSLIRPAVLPNLASSSKFDGPSQPSVRVPNTLTYSQSAAQVVDTTPSTLMTFMTSKSTNLPTTGTSFSNVPACSSTPIPEGPLFGDDDMKD
ncbi:hypothetical protein A7U60_g3479 [Sanghuangporus baumii]|uniref:Chromo domain-containing protein n=1 Tax=Sanghuangporus baumii TaxID=108892 RepID=A0A9Q5N9W7_SANBA|nr:hypothetical protein A7U60_g3479 [Sanghuangporus baumii]